MKKTLLNIRDYGRNLCLEYKGATPYREGGGNSGNDETGENGRNGDVDHRWSIKAGNSLGPSLA